MTRAEILEEFGSPACEHECHADECISERKMADEIVRLRSILAALREPSEAVVEAGCIARFGLRNWTIDGQDEYEWRIYQLRQFTDQLVAAVHAAEKEVINGN